MLEKINYLRVILTANCNLKCDYCHKEGVSENFSRELSPNFLIKLLHCLYGIGIKKIKFMGGEPTLYKALPEVLRNIRHFDADISLISNGVFNKKFIEECFNNGLQRINISIHAWSDLKLAEKIGMSLKQLNLLHENLNYLIASKKLTKLNYVYLKRNNLDEFYAIMDWINSNEQVLDILNLLSDDEIALSQEQCTFEEIFSKIRARYTVHEVGVHKNFCSLDSLRIKLAEGGTVNLKIFPLNESRPFSACDGCKKFSYCREGIRAIRLTHDGFLQPCLFRYDNRFYVGDMESESPIDIIRTLNDWLAKL